MFVVRVMLDRFLILWLCNILLCLISVGGQSIVVPPSDVAVWEGEQLVVDCKVDSQGNPGSISVAWLQNEDNWLEIGDRYMWQDENHVDGNYNLLVAGTDVELDNGLYTCHLYVDDLLVDASNASVTIIVESGEPYIVDEKGELITQPLTYDATSVRAMFCVVENANPKLLVGWKLSFDQRAVAKSERSIIYFSAKDVNGDRNNTITTIVNTTFELSSSSDAHLKAVYVTCTFSSGPNYFPDKQVHFTAYIKIKPTVDIEAPDETINIGRTLQVYCHAHAAQPFSYAWRKNGLVLQDETDWYIQIHPATFSDQGFYQCQVCSDWSGCSDLSDTLRITINITVPMIDDDAEYRELTVKKGSSTVMMIPFCVSDFKQISWSWGEPDWTYNTVIVTAREIGVRKMVTSKISVYVLKDDSKVDYYQEQCLISNLQIDDFDKDEIQCVDDCPYIMVAMNSAGTSTAINYIVEEKSLTVGGIIGIILGSVAVVAAVIVAIVLATRPVK